MPLARPHPGPLFFRKFCLVLQKLRTRNLSLQLDQSSCYDVSCLGDLKQPQPGWLPLQTLPLQTQGLGFLLVMCFRGVFVTTIGSVTKLPAVQPSGLLPEMVHMAYPHQLLQTDKHCVLGKQPVYSSVTMNSCTDFNGM